jgi:quinohemoprotein ethanol dehydrogenase
LTSSWSVVYAIDAASGDEIWRYDPKVPGEVGRKACCDVVNRGVAVYNGRVYVASLDGRLIALDATDGSEIWQVDTVIDRSRFYTITGAPRVAGGKVFIGNGGAEFGVRGYVTAYDAETGEQAWRFFTVPGNPSLPFEHPEMELAATTWKGGAWWEIGGGGTVWNSIVYDPDFNQLYIGVGNGSPWTRVIRSPGGGDNLFLSSIVALDADTGRMNWYYQTTPGDNWDYTAVQDIMLAEMDVDGKQRKVLMQAPKNGFFYVIDRADGKLLRAHPFATVTWATHVDLKTGRPVENPALAYDENPKWILPGPLGAHNWQAMSFDAKRRLVFIPAQDAPLLYAMEKDYGQTGLFKRDPGGWNLGIEITDLIEMMDDQPEGPAAKGYLKAFDPLTGESKWTIEHPHYWNGGVLSTAGSLVFQGDALGFIVAYDADTGEDLWRFNAHTSILAPPVSYAIDGVQYVSILTGTGGGDLATGEHAAETAAKRFGNFGRLLTFKLDGKETLPAPTAVDRTIPEQPAVAASADGLRRGKEVYGQYCTFCHGFSVRSGGVVADLRMMSAASHQAFEEIVLGGAMAGRGMASFADVLSAEDATMVHAYIISRANEDRATASEEAAR